VRFCFITHASFSGSAIGNKIPQTREWILAIHKKAFPLPVFKGNTERFCVDGKNVV
jgi:hypothetical protein